MKRTVRYLIVGLLAVAILAAAIVWLTRGQVQPEQTAREAIVERGSMLIAVAATGRIEPVRRVELSFDLPGQVAEVRVSIGDRVTAGQPLVWLDARQLELQVEKAEAALMLARAQAEQLRAGPRTEELSIARDNLRAAEAQLAAVVANRDQVASGATAAQLAAVEAQVASAELQRKVAQDNYDKTVRSTDDEDVVAQANYELYAAQRALEAAQAELERLQSGAAPEDMRAAGANVATAVAQRDAAQARLDLLLAGPTHAQVADADAQVAAAQAALASAKLSLETAELNAPFDGVVIGVNAVAGELAPSFAPAVVLADLTGYRVTVGVDEIDIGRLSEGMPAEVVIEAFRDEVLAGKVERIAPVADLTGGIVSYDVVVALDQSDIPVQVDMTANVTIIIDELDDVLKIPIWAVRVDGTTGQTYVDRRVGRELERVDVRLGVRYEGFAEVLDGVAVGDVIVLTSDAAFGLGR